jgi:nitrogen fixation NifU-like protein
MTTLVKGHTLEEVDALFDRFHTMVTKGIPEDDVESMGRLAAFSGVCDYPTRIKCASLAWHTLKAAIHQAAEPVSTE